MLSQQMQRSGLIHRVEFNEIEDKRSMSSHDSGLDGKPLNEGVKHDKMRALAQDLKFGRFGVSWEEIKNAVDTLNIELIDNELLVESFLVEDKGDRSVARWKGTEWELHNLSFKH